MFHEYSITLDHIILLNKSNQLIITIPLDTLWNFMIEYEYAYINAFLKIQLLKKAEISTLYLALHQEYKVSDISARLKKVVLTGTFDGIVDEFVPITGISTIICYNVQ